MYINNFGVINFNEYVAEHSLANTLRKRATIHLVTTMLTTSKNVLFPGHNHLLTIGIDDLTLQLSPLRTIISIDG